MFDWLTSTYKAVTRSLGYDKPHEFTVSLAEHFGKNEAAALDLLHEIQKIGWIAGSSVAALLITRPDFVDHVGDVDVFVDTEVAFNRILDLLTHTDAEYRVFDHETEAGQKGKIVVGTVSVVSVQHPSMKIPIQVVMHKDDSPYDLIAHFDMDYIQCALHDDVLHTTSAFDDVRQTGQSTRFNVSHPPRAYRLSKTLNKGFSVPLYGLYNADGSPLSMIRATQEEVRAAQKKYLSTYWEEHSDYVRSTEMVRYSDLQVSHWVSTWKKTCSEWSGKPIYRCGNFVLKDTSDREYPVPCICVRVVITAYYEDRHRVRVDCPWLKQLGAGGYAKLGKNCEVPVVLKDKDGDFVPEVYSAVMKLYIHDGQRYGKIIQLLPCNGAILSPTISPDFHTRFRPGSDWTY